MADVVDSMIPAGRLFHATGHSFHGNLISDSHFPAFFLKLNDGYSIRLIDDDNILNEEGLRIGQRFGVVDGDRDKLIWHGYSPADSLYVEAPRHVEKGDPDYADPHLRIDAAQYARKAAKPNGKPKDAEPEAVTVREPQAQPQQSVKASEDW